ncbi:polymer-forming cytoskeletal protein [Elusimicrobiota bacterium]
MFGKNDGVKIANDKILTVIASETFVQGTIRTQGSIRIDGKTEGNIYDAKGVIIGESGQIQGDIVAESVVVGGKVIGNIEAAKVVEVLARGQILGDIHTKALHIEDGAVFDGTCTMNVDSGEKILEPETKPILGSKKQSVSSPVK